MHTVDLLLAAISLWILLCMNNKQASCNSFQNLPFTQSHIKRAKILAAIDGLICEFR